ncbi:hypothetical protein [Sphingosinicella soli]|uniref:Uncharacterized protein n=1 Tax=Sphingosinicella soli TaxID=333708 RepID=A0A7W7AZY6_9SPHN|nr:hypothetical protein [Sphingosinicella soli]MBB4631464.1 hypothetical protein [Sphingosinicella soli]
MLWWVAGAVGALLFVALLAPPAPGKRSLNRIDFSEDAQDSDENSDRRD